MVNKQASTSTQDQLTLPEAPPPLVTVAMSVKLLELACAMSVKLLKLAWNSHCN